ncbi:MAG TPA: ThuA domain-containing protein [Bacteroidia bacterium]|nr:ThuA domain-containing protein [Bacteroidia bacterium]
MKTRILRLVSSPQGIALLGAAALFATAIGLTACGERAMAAAAEKTKIVLIAGKKSHPSGQHEFNAGAILLARALNEQSGLSVDVKVVHDGWPEDESILDGAKSLVIYSDGNASHPANGHEAKIDELIAKGTGLMLMHYAVEVPKGEQGERFKRWIGGQYEAGSSTNPHWTAKVEIKENHPIGRGVPGFSANDEWYYAIRFADPKTADDIVTGTPTRAAINRYIHWTPDGEKGLDKRQTMMWAVERADGGRGLGFTGGHWHRNWAIDDFRKLVLNAILWTAKVEVPEHGTVSEAITEAQLNENLDPKDKMEHVALPSQADLTQPAAEPVEFRWPGKK